MTKTFNNDAIFFLSLSVGMGIFHCLLYMTVGADLPAQHSYANFFLLASIISSFAAAFILRSYYDQGFRAAFVTGLIAFFTALLRVVLLYYILVPLNREFQRYYSLVLILDLTATLIAAGSLVLSRAGKNRWLRGAGTLSFLAACITLAFLFWSMQVYSGRSIPALEKWQLCLSFVASLQPLLFIGYFRQLPAVQSQFSDSALSSWQTNLLITVQLLGVAMFLFLGVSLMGEGMRATRPQPEATSQARIFKARTFKDRRGQTLSYRLLTPEGYDSTQRYPLVVRFFLQMGENIR